MTENLRSIFDSACGEYLGAKESVEKLSFLMERDNKTFEQILIDYISLIDDERMYWLEGLSHSLWVILPDSKEAREYILSYKWENLFLFRPFNRRSYPFYYWQGLLENTFHRLVNNARELNGKLQTQHTKSIH
jgi:hypothetical protein